MKRNEDLFKIGDSEDTIHRGLVRKWALMVYGLCGHTKKHSKIECFFLYFTEGKGRK